MKVLITRTIPRSGIDLLKRHPAIELDYRQGNPLSKKELIDAIKDADGLISVIPDKIDSEIIESAKKLRVISQYSVGYDNVDIRAATQKGICVTNTPGNFESSAAEFTVGLMLALAKQIIPAHKYTQGGQYKFWDPMLFLSPQVTGKTLGIVGFGKIGQETAKIAHFGFDMQVLYYDIKRDPQTETQTGAMYTGLDTLVRNSDFVSVHTPLLPSTHHLISASELRKMKDSSYLINISRGPVVDETALLAALKERRIAGAALDVFEREPEITEGLSELDNVILTPHIATATKETRSEMAKTVVENLLQVLVDKKTPKNLVNKEVLEKIQPTGTISEITLSS